MSLDSLCLEQLYIEERKGKVQSLCLDLQSFGNLVAQCLKSNITHLAAPVMSLLNLVTSPNFLQSS